MGGILYSLMEPFILARLHDFSFFLVMGNQVSTLQKKQKIEHGKHPHLIIARHNTLVPWPTLIILFSEMLKF
jgi:hypothetical protein